MPPYNFTDLHTQSAESGHPIQESVPPSNEQGLPLIAVIVLVVAIILFVGIIFTPSSWMVRLYDFIRRDSKCTTPALNKTKDEQTYQFFNPSKKAEYERKLREEEESNKSFLRIHLDALRSWKKPVRHKSSETTIMMSELPTLRPPPPVQSTPQYHGRIRTYADWKKHEERLKARKAATEPNKIRPSVEEH